MSYKDSEDNVTWDFFTKENELQLKKYSFRREWWKAIRERRHTKRNTKA